MIKSSQNIPPFTKRRLSRQTNNFTGNVAGTHYGAPYGTPDNQLHGYLPAYGTATFSVLRSLDSGYTFWGAIEKKVGGVITYNFGRLHGLLDTRIAEKGTKLGYCISYPPLHQVVGDAVQQWTPNTVRAVSSAEINWCFPTIANRNGWAYQVVSVTGDARTGATEPVWNTTADGTTVDGNVTYRTVRPYQGVATPAEQSSVMPGDTTAMQNLVNALLDEFDDNIAYFEVGNEVSYGVTNGFYVGRAESHVSEVWAVIDAIEARTGHKPIVYVGGITLHNYQRFEDVIRLFCEAKDPSGRYGWEALKSGKARISWHSYGGRSKFSQTAQAGDILTNDATSFRVIKKVLNSYGIYDFRHRCTEFGVMADPTNGYGAPFPYVSQPDADREILNQIRTLPLLAMEGLDGIDVYRLTDIVAGWWCGDLVSGSYTRRWLQWLDGIRSIHSIEQTSIDLETTRAVINGVVQTFTRPASYSALWR